MNLDLDTHNGRVNARRLVLVGLVLVYTITGLAIKLTFF